jgi:transglutaminase-like putative cysteine protease
VILAAIAPIIVPGFGSKAVIDLSQVNGDNRVHVSPFVSIGAVLNQPDNVEVFQVRSDQPAYWRMVGLDQFDANGAWNTIPEQGQPAPVGEPLPGEAVDPSWTPVDATFTVESDLAFTTLPVPYAPSELVSADDPVSWFPRSQALSVAEWPDKGSTYHLRSVSARPTAADLRSTTAGSEASFPTDTQLPQEPEIAEIRGLAKEWTAGEQTDFDKAMAIQRHLRTFGYDKSQTYPGTLGGLLQFLTSTQVGFCEHFASAMAVMLRTLDIPARVATGFTFGSPIGDDTYTVSTDDLHAWVEVPFEGYGWLPFEPTPGGMVNPSMSYTAGGKTDTFCPARDANCKIPGGGHHTGHHPEPNNLVKNKEQSAPINRSFDPSTVAPPGSRGASGRFIVASLAFGATAVLAGIPLARWLRRRRRLAHAREPRELILATYDVFSERAADLGLGRGPGETPSEYRRRIEATDLLTDGHMERLTGTVVRAAYSARPVSHDDALDATADADQVIRDLRRSTSLRRRIVGIYRRD